LVLDAAVPSERLGLNGLLFKAVAIMRGLLDLTRNGKNAEAMILARALADHVITFAWLAIDPARNYPRWERDDARERLRAQSRWEKRGRTLLAPSVKRMFERRQANQVKYPPDLAQLGDKADEYWAARLGFRAGDRPFADTYDVIFKHCSSRTHASIQGLNDVLEMTPDHAVLVLDRGADHQAGALRASLMIFGLGLKVAAETLALPARHDVERLFAEYLARRDAIDTQTPGV
jgi:hypothetical protein